MFMFLLTGYSGDNWLTYTDPCSSGPCHSTSACKSEETRYMCYCTHGEVLTDTGCKGNGRILHMFILHFKHQPINQSINQSSIWASKLHWLDNFLLFTVTDRNIAFSGTPSTCYLLSFGNLIVNPVHFLLTENIKRDNQGEIM